MACLFHYDLKIIVLYQVETNSHSLKCIHINIHLIDRMGGNWIFYDDALLKDLNSIWRNNRLCSVML